MKENMYKRHKLPRKQPMTNGQRLCVWLGSMLLVSLVIVLASR